MDEARHFKFRKQIVRGESYMGGGATDDKTTNRRFGHHVIDTHTE